MKGRVLGVEADGSGVVVSDTGTRFRFGPGDWRGQRDPSAGASVDFDAVDDSARDIYPAISPMSGLTSAIDLDALRTSGGGEKLQGFIRRPVALPVAAAGLALIAFLLPALSTPEVSTSLLDLGRIPALMAPAAAMMGDGEGLGAAASLLWLRFASPLAAAALIFFAVTSRPMGKWPLIAGAAAIVAGAMPFLLKSAIIGKVQSEAFMGAMVGDSLGALIQVGPGAWLSLLAGAALIAAGLGVLKNPLSSPRG